MPLICFASPKGGVGKTTIAANVAFELSRAGWPVLALDLDPQNSLRLHFGLSLRDGGGFMNALDSGTDWRRAVRGTRSGVKLLPFGTTELQGAVSLSHRLAERPGLLADPLREMLARPDLVVVADTEPGPSASIAALLPIVDLLVNVLLVDAMSAAQMPAIENGIAYGTAWGRRPGATMAGKLGFVLNGFDPRTRLGPAILGSLRQHTGSRMLGMVHRDENVAEAVATQTLVGQYAAGAQATRDLARVAEAIAQRIAPLSAVAHPVLRVATR